MKQAIKLCALTLFLLFAMSSCAQFDIVAGKFLGEDIRVQAAKVVNSTPKTAEGFYKTILTYYAAAEKAAELNPSPEAEALLAKWNEHQKEAAGYIDRFKRVHDTLRLLVEDSETSDGFLQSAVEEVLDLVQELAIRRAIRKGG